MVAPGAVVMIVLAGTTLVNDRVLTLVTPGKVVVCS